MVEKRILLAVADPSAGETFRDALGKQWVVTAVASGTAALAEMRQHPCQVVVADLDLPELDGASLLQQVRKKHPKTIRFILAPEGEQNQVMKRVLGGGAPVPGQTAQQIDAEKCPGTGGGGQRLDPQRQDPRIGWAHPRLSNRSLTLLRACQSAQVAGCHHGGGG